MVDPARVIRMRLETMFSDLHDAGENVSQCARELAAALRWREYVKQLTGTGETRARAIAEVLRQRQHPLLQISDVEMVKQHAPEVFEIYEKSVSEGDVGTLCLPPNFDAVEGAARALACKRSTFVGKCVEAVLLDKEDVVEHRRVFRFAVEHEDERLQTQTFQGDMRDVERKHKRARLDEESGKRAEMQKLEAKYEKNKHEYARRLMSLEILKLE